MAKGTCAVEGCTRYGKLYRAWCTGHYARWRSTGDVQADVPLRVRGGTLEDYFWPKVDKNGPNGCWLWTANSTRWGYGLFTYDGHTHSVHRLAYERLVGPIPEGLQLDHLCRNPPCCNPAHLEPVTHAENMRRRFALVTHCKWGHEFTPENTVVFGDRGRRCRECARRRIREFKARRRADAKAGHRGRGLLRAGTKR